VVSISAIIAATVSGMLLGALWYSPLLFGRQWMAAIGKTEADIGSPTGPMIGSVLACLVSAIAVALVVAMTGVSGVGQGFGLGLILGVGVVAPALLSDNLFCGWGLPLFWIQAGYRVSYITIMTMLQAAWPW
jgi:hypothetical protein